MANQSDRCLSGWETEALVDISGVVGSAAPGSLAKETNKCPRYD